MRGFETIIYHKEGRRARITLNRPQVMNAVSVQMRDELWEALSAVRDDPDISVAIIQGAGERAFCAGADVTEFGTAPSRVIARQVRWERDLWGLFLSLPQVLIAALHGYVLGAGLEMSLCCDFRVAAEDARLGVPEVALGMIPSAGGSQTVPRMAPLGKAMELLLTGEPMTAHDAYRLGVVHRVVPRDHLMTIVDALASKVMARSPAAVRWAKEAVRRGIDLPLEEGLRLEARLYSQALIQAKDSLLAQRAGNPQT